MNLSPTVPLLYSARPGRLVIGLPDRGRSSMEEPLIGPAVYHYFVSPIVVNAATWSTSSSPADTLEELLGDYPDRVDNAETASVVPEWIESGLIGSEPTQRVRAQFTWQTAQGLPVRSHLTVLGNATGVGVLHITVPPTVDEDVLETVSAIADSARLEATSPRRIPDSSGWEPYPAGQMIAVHTTQSQTETQLNQQLQPQTSLIGGHGYPTDERG